MIIAAVNMIILLSFDGQIMHKDGFLCNISSCGFAQNLSVYFYIVI